MVGQYALQAYDECKKSRSAEDCRQSVANLIPRFVKAYLVSYDVCQRGFKQEKCRQMFAPQAGGLPLWTVAVALGVGILIGRRI